MATSTCVGDYENGASWGPVVYTDNCYTGKGTMIRLKITTFLFLARLHEVHRAIVVTSVVRVYVYVCVRVRVTLSVKVF